jgi:FkbM family methyltransferase
MMLSREIFIMKPIEIEFELLFFLKCEDNLTILDVGACEAEDSIRYSNLFPFSTIYAFEPRADNCAKAKELIKQYNKTNIILENIALSNKNGFSDFYLSEGEPPNLHNDKNWDYGNKSSSLLPPSKEMKNYTGWLKFEKTIKVKTQTLADYVEEKGIHGIDFMHLDVQGAELMVLEGAGGIYREIKIIWMEVESVELYKNQPLRSEVESFMTDRGFVNVLNTVNHISGDQLYINQLFFSKRRIKNLYSALRRRKYLSLPKSFLGFKWL